MLLLLCRPRVYSQFVRRGTECMVNLEGLLEEGSSLWGDITGDGWPCRARANLVDACKQPVVATCYMETAYLENSLHLRELGEWVLAREHFDNEAAKTPNIRLACVRGLLDDLGGHPEHGALQRRPMVLGQGYTHTNTLARSTQGK